MRYGKKERVAVIQRNDGKFLALDISVGATSHSYVDNPIDAHKFVPYNPQENLREPTYYLENSERAKIWAENCKCVWVEIEYIATIIPPVGFYPKQLT